MILLKILQLFYPNAQQEKSLCTYLFKAIQNKNYKPSTIAQFTQFRLNSENDMVLSYSEARRQQQKTVEEA